MANAKYYTASAETEHQTTQHGRKNTKSYTKSAVDKREQRLHAQAEQKDDENAVLKSRLRQLRQSGEVRRREAEQNTSALEEALESAQRRLTDNEDRGPLDFRLPNGSYDPGFAIMCGQVVAAGAAPAIAGDVVQTVMEWTSGRPLASKPCPNSFGEWNRTLKIVSEGVLAKRIQQNSTNDNCNALHYDHTSKYGVNLTGAAIALHDKVLPLGISATPSKSAADQLAALQRMRADVASSGAAVFGLPARDPLAAIGAVVTDGGATENAMWRTLQQQQQNLHKEFAKDEKKREGKQEKGDSKSEMLKLECHKHKLSNITTEMQKNGINATGTGKKTAMDAEFMTAKGFRQTSKWGHNKGAEFDAFCQSKHEQNFVKEMGPTKHTRHHLRFASMRPLLLSIPLLTKFIANVAAKSKSNAEEADTDARAKANTLNRSQLLRLSGCHNMFFLESC